MALLMHCPCSRIPRNSSFVRQFLFLFLNFLLYILWDLQKIPCERFSVRLMTRRLGRFVFSQGNRFPKNNNSRKRSHAFLTSSGFPLNFASLPFALLPLRLNSQAMFHFKKFNVFPRLPKTSDDIFIPLGSCPQSS